MKKRYKPKNQNIIKLKQYLKNTDLEKKRRL